MAPLRAAGYVDPGWEHGVAQDEKKKKVKCNYCGKVVSGGIYRLKQHLARISGEVTYCDRAPEDVYMKMRENLEGCRSSKKQRLVEDDEQAYLNIHSQEDDDEMDSVGYRRKGKKVLGDKSAIVDFTPLRSLGYVDPGWEHGVAQDERKKKVKCNYCGKIVSGGINRFKQHLARIPGEVAPCKSAPEDVFMKIKENMKWHRTGRRLRRPYVKETSEFYPQSENEAAEDEQDEDVMCHMDKEKVVLGDKMLSKDLKRVYSGMSFGSNSEMFLKKSRFSSNSLKTPTYYGPQACKQPNSGFSKQNRKEVVSAICEFFYHAGVPSHAVGSVYFQKMLELVGQYGPGLSIPSSRLVSGRLLQDEVASIKNYLVEYKASWAVTGCSIMADSWKDAQGRVLINFLVSCPRGVYFVSSADVTEMIDNASSLFKLLDKIVDEIGEENVVQVVTQNTLCYKTAGKMLEDKRRNLFWTPCATYCIDRMLEDFMKIKLVADCMEKGQKITKFIYNRTWLLNLMKKEFTMGQEILRPAITRYAASFATLQGLLEHKIALKQLFQSNKWLSSRFSKSDEGKEVEKIILRGSFWKKSQYIRKSIDPILQLLQKVDSDGSLSMPSVYNDMYKAKLTIRSMYGDDVHKYGPFWSVIDNHCSSLFHHPLCVAAYFLNPAYRYRSDYLTNPEVMRGLNECIVRMEPDNGRQISASMQISDFISAKADFGTDLAISTRTELDPAAWWQQHGINCLELQHIAVRILSQTCSSFGCEHHWSIYDQIHSQRRNRLAQKKLNDLVYAHYNLRLRERQLRRCNDSVLLDNVLLEGLLDDWIVEAEKQSIQNDEDIIYNEDGYEFEVAEFDDNNIDARKGGSLEMVTLADIEHMEVHSNGGGATDDDDDLNFFDEDTSE